jgi:hypothetical protein
LTMALETETDGQFIGDELKVGRFLQRDKILRNWLASGGQSGQWSPPESWALKSERFCSQRVRSR